MQGTMTSLILAETWKMDVIGGWISLVTLFELGGLGWLFLFELNFLNEFVSLINGFMSCLYFNLVRLNLEKYNESSFSVYIYIYIKAIIISTIILTLKLRPYLI